MSTSAKLRPGQDGQAVVVSGAEWTVHVDATADPRHIAPVAKPLVGAKHVVADVVVRRCRDLALVAGIAIAENGAKR